MANITKRNKLFSFGLLEKRALELWNGYIEAEATIDPASLTTGTIGLGSPATITVPGAELGDFVVASYNGATSGVAVAGSVSAANTVSLAFINPTAGTVNLAPGSVTVRVYKR
jgi:hypothetical protein